MTSDDDAGGATPSLDATTPAASARRTGQIVATNDGVVASVTPVVGRYLGMDPATLVGESLAELTHPDDRDAVHDAIEAAASDDGPASPIRVRFAGADGAPREARLDVTALRGDGRDAYAVGVIPLSGRAVASADLVGIADSIEELHGATNRLHASRTIDDCTEIVIDAAVGVLGFDWCLLAAPTPDGMFRIEAVSDGAPLAVGDRPLSVDEGVSGHVYRTKEGAVTADSSASARSEPTHDFIRSSLTAPVGDWGIFQALSKTPASFDDDDLKLAEVLATSMATTIERIEQERQLRGQRNQLKRQYGRIESLHRVATEMKGLDTREAVYDAVIGAAEEILAFDICIIDEIDGDALVPTAVGSNLSIEDYYEETPIDRDNNIAARTAREGETIVVNDLRTTEYAPAQSDYRSILSVPLDELGVFQAGSNEPDAFDDTDRRLTELLVEHAVATVDRIDRERELERRATELERQNERLDEFGSLVSHDLRTPLSIATGYLENARTMGDDEALAEVASALDRMDALIDDMLALARGGPDELDVEPLPLEHLAREQWTDLGTPEAALECRDGLPETIRGDERRLKRVFENLFRNAVEHAGADVTVTVGDVGERGFYVADDGPGIPTEERSRVFEHGHSGAGGTGLGLAIVRDIAHAHGWAIELAESASGGARFEFRPESGA